jgi:hypothetical protein
VCKHVCVHAMCARVLNTFVHTGIVATAIGYNRMEVFKSFQVACVLSMGALCGGCDNGLCVEAMCGGCDNRLCVIIGYNRLCVEDVIIGLCGGCDNGLAS